jgi:hypothetical protein
MAEKEILHRRSTDVPYLDIVLAKFGNEYVTWIHNKSFSEECYNHGHYFSINDYDKAYQDFLSRTV